MGSVAGAKPAKELSLVLCVDLDGTLIRGNVLWECVLVLLKTQPFTLLLLPFWLLPGAPSSNATWPRAFNSTPLVSPYRQQVLDLLRQEKAARPAASRSRPLPIASCRIHFQLPRFVRRSPRQ